MVISQFHPIIGGAEKQAQLLAKKLIERGVDVNIVTGWWNPKTPRREKIDGIRVFRNFSCWGMFGIKGVRILGGLSYMASLGIYLLVHNRDYDMIHVHQALYPAFISALFGKELLHKPVLVKSASSGVTSDIKLLGEFPFGKLQLKSLLKKMDCLVAMNRTIGKEFMEAGYSESRIAYIPNGVVVPSQKKSHHGDVKCVLTTSRLSREKGIDVLLKAWAKVLQEEKDLKLVILGQGPLKSELEMLSQSLRLGESVTFNGFVHNVPEYLRSSDLFVLPSRAEGMSNALLEAMGYGIPCIATRVGGNDELIKPKVTEGSIGKYLIGENGLLVNSEDIQGLSEAILYLIRDRRAREEMGQRSRKFIQENYSIDLIADRYITLYQRMVDGKF